MYAIIEADGRQYKVTPGDTIKSEKLSQEKGTEVSFDKVLMINNEDKLTYGSPYVTGAKVIASIEDAGKSRKVIIYKQRPRKGYRKLNGHRQPYSLLKIKEIVFGG
ncbi:MAG: 50S ribosomal protein L21 [Nitrospirota bacterium]